MPECRKLGTVKGPACGCPDNACVLEIDDEQWPYDPDLTASIEDTMDEDPESERNLKSWTLLKPHGIMLHQATFTTPGSVVAHEPERMWEVTSLKTLLELLSRNGILATYDQWYDDELDEHFGRWTVEEVTEAHPAWEKV